MARALKTVAAIAAVVALSFAIPGVGTAIGAQFGVAISASTAASIAAIASVVSTTASHGKHVLTKGAGP